MQMKKIGIALALLSLLPAGACGGSKPKAAPAGNSAQAAQSGAQNNSSAKKNNSNLPEWVIKGSGAFNAERGRVIWGVGSASGIKNPSLLRTTADASARNNLSKVFNTFVAGITKSYMASNTAGGVTSEEQVAESVMVAANAMNIQASQIVDRFLDSDGTLYALAMVDMDEMEKIAALIKEGTIKAFIVENGDKVFDDLAKMLKPPAAKQVPPRSSEPLTPAPAQAAAPKQEEPKKEAKEDKVVKRTARPDWVDGPSADYPENAYLCGVGIGRARKASENSAKNAIASIFSVKINGVINSYQSSLSRTGYKLKGKSERLKNGEITEAQEVEEMVRAETEKSLSGVEIKEIFEDKDGQIYALACIHRESAAKNLRSEIEDLDDKADKALEQAGKGTRFQKLKKLANVLSILRERSLKNSDLRVIDPDGLGIAPEISYSDIELALLEALEHFSIALEVDGPAEAADDIRNALLQGLNSKLFQVASEESENTIDAIFKVSLRLEDAGMGGPNGAYYMFRGVVKGEIMDTESEKIIISMDASNKQGMASPEEAKRKVVRKISADLAKKVAAKLDEYLSN